MSARPAPKFAHLLTRGSTSGFEVAGAVVFFLLIGLGLDALFGTGPVFAIVFGVLGFVSGFLRMFYADRYDAAWRETMGLPPEQQREVPAVLADRAAAKAAVVPGSTERVTAFDDWTPRRFGDPVPPELRDGSTTDAATVAGAERESA